MMNHDHSDLEVTQAGLEIDHGSDAPQVVVQPDENAPQVAPGTAPEPRYDRSPLYSTNDPDEKAPAAVLGPSPSKSFLWTKKAFWISLSVALLAAIAIGVGAGVGVSRNHSTNSTPTSTQPSQPTSSNSPVTSNVAVHSVANGTYLASSISLNGERHVFFQEHSGIIREAVFQNNQSWAAPVSYVVATDARNNTPMDAYTIPPWNIGNGGNTLGELVLFYVSENNTLSASVLEGQWQPSPIKLNGVDLVNVSSSAKSLSATFAQRNSFSNVSQSVFYENSDGLYRAIYTSGSPDNQTWFDAGLQNLSLTNATIQSPVRQCYLDPDTQEGGDQIFGYLTLLNGSQYSVVIVQSGDETAAVGSTLDFSLVGSADSMPPSFTESDLTCNYVFSPNYGSTGGRVSYWVNGTALQPYSSAVDSVPLYTFPFKRLTAVTPFNSTLHYVYAQFNGSILSEHLYDLQVGHWTSSNFSIDTT